MANYLQSRRSGISVNTFVFTTILPMLDLRKCILIYYDKYTYFYLFCQF